MGEGGLPWVLREYGQAFRGDWSSGADGRDVCAGLVDVAGWIENPGTYPGDAGARERLGICPAGGGHWLDHCADDCAAPSVELRKGKARVNRKVRTVWEVYIDGRYVTYRLTQREAREAAALREGW